MSVLLLAGASSILPMRQPARSESMIAGIKLGSDTVENALGPQSGTGKVQMGNHELVYGDYRFGGAQLTCQFDSDKLVLIGMELTSGQRATEEDSGVVAFAEKAAVQAVNFREGDAAGFARNRTSFTEAGWKDFTKSMQGYLDAKGAPAFTSTFVASGRAKVLGQDGGIVHLRIPGTLTQGNKASRTTYRGALEVRAGGKPAKIEKLEQITCAGSSAACQ